MNDIISTRQIDQLLAWGGKFLRATSTKPEIMELMKGLGYSEAEHKAGWELYLKMLGYRGAAAAPAPIPMSTTDQLRALNEIDRFDEPTFRRATAALKRLHPDQHEYFFSDGLAAQTGPASVGSVQLFLDRYVALRDGTDPNRIEKRDADQAAAKTLELRNIVNPTIEGELRKLIAAVQLPAPLPTPTQVSGTEEVLRDAVTAFQSWLSDWRTTASVGIHRRDYRVMLGVSKRRSTVESEEEAEETDVPTSNAAPAAPKTQTQPTAQA